MVFLFFSDIVTLFLSPPVFSCHKALLRGLTFPQFLDALVRLALLMSFREHSDVEDGYAVIGVHKHGGILAMVPTTDTWTATGDEHDEFDDGPLDKEREIQAAVDAILPVPIDQSHNAEDIEKTEDRSWSSAMERAKCFGDAVNLNEKIQKYIITPFEHFTG